MLASMRVLGSSLPMKIFLGLLVVSFAVWGVGSSLRSGGSNHLATVGNEVVTYPEFARSLSSTERMLQGMGMKDVPQDTIAKQVLQRLVEEKIVEQRLTDAGLQVNDSLLASHIRSAPELQGLTGKFDAQKFNGLLQQRQISEKMFLGEIATDIRAQTFTASLTADRMQPPEALAKLYDSIGTEKRDVVLLTLPASAVKVTAPDEAALKSYYEANKGLLYMLPERRTIEYVTFSADDVAKRAAKDITTEAVADRVASDPEGYKGAAGEKKAREELKNEAMDGVMDSLTIAIEDALAAGETMGQAVATAGLSAQSRVLRDVTEKEVEAQKDPVARVAGARGFTMLEGETSNIETTKDGSYYMVAVQSLTAAEPKPYDTVKADVEKRAQARARTKAMRNQANKLAAAIKDTKDVASVAKEFGASSRPVSNVKRGGATIAAALNEAVFEREVGEVAGPLVEENDAQLALVTASHFDTAVKSADAKSRATMGEELQKEMLGNYYQTLTQEYPVRINQGMMQQILHGQGDGA